METHVGFAAVQPKNGTVTIPAALRRRFGLDKPGAQVEIVVRGGEIVLVPHVAVPADQAWFWTDDWRARERQADEDRNAGRHTALDSGDDLLRHLEGLSADADRAQ
ncbi:MAG: AbrB/MazE/SpoVT family DNA-binding domain-containing protein [Jiangellaceae bacterium]